MINWKEIPFMRILLPFVVGIFSAVLIDIAHWGIYLISAILFIFLLFFKYFQSEKFKHRWLFGIPFYLLVFLLGYLWCFHHNETRWNGHFQEQLEEENFIVGTVVNSPSDGNYLNTHLKVQQIGQHPDSLKNTNGNLLVYFKSTDSISTIEYGDVIALKTKIQKAQLPNNPNAFNFQRYLHYQNIHYQAFIYDTLDWTIVQQGQGNLITQNTIALQKHFLSILKKHIPTDNELAVGSALILGHKEDLNPDVKNAYARTGAMHVLAVSGLHVGLVTGFIILILNFFFQSKKIGWQILKIAIVIFATWAFALVTGGSPSVLRAATMFSFITVGYTINRPSSIYNSIAISAVILLLYNPYLLMHVGFQLSYLAVLGIIFFQPKFHKWLVFENRILNYAWGLITVALAAQLSTFPISIFYFHQFPIYFWLSGLVVIPAAALILGSGIALFLFHWVPAIGHCIGKFLYGSIWMMNQFIFLTEQLPFSVWLGIWIGIPILILLYLKIGGFAMMYQQKNYRWLLFVSSLFLISSINFSFTTLHDFHQKKIFIYHLTRNTIIDFFDGKNGFSIYDKNIDQKKLSFTTQNNRWANGVKNIQPIPLTNDDFQSDNLLVKFPFIQFYDKKIALINDLENDLPKEKTPKIELDFLIIYGNPKLQITNLLQSYNPRQIIFDASSSKWKIKKWKQECQELNIPTYDINNKGALEISF